MPANRPNATKPNPIPTTITPVLLAGLIVVGGTLLYVKSQADRSPMVGRPEPSWAASSTPIVSPIASVSPSSATPDPYAGWVTYSNRDLGFSFRYPSEWGAVSLSHKDGDTGTLFSGQFSSNSLLTFAGQTPNYSVGAGAGFLNFSGCTRNSNDSYACQFAPGKSRTITPSRVVTTADGNTGLILFDTDIPQVLSATTRGALVNLSGKDYPGIALQYLQIPASEEAAFDKVVTSVTSL